jgi:hypothetical protein
MLSTRGVTTTKLRLVVVPGSMIKLGSTINLPSFSKEFTFYPYSAINNYKKHEQ